MLNALIRLIKPIVVTGLLTCAGLALAQQAGPSEQELKQANNPLASMKAFNMQNYYVPKLDGLGEATANTFWLRGVAPAGRVLVRASLPLSTVPSGASMTSGLGDFNIFGAYLLQSTAESSFGVGPLLVVPTASDDALGTGKWQAGAAAVVFKMPSARMQYGALLTLQASFAGDEDRAATSVLAAQPFLIFQLGGGTYLRSAPLMAFDLRSGDYNVPFGLGIGKVLKIDQTVYNIFLEPQFTILHEGVGQPLLQIFTGLNLQF